MGMQTSDMLCSNALFQFLDGFFSWFIHIKNIIDKKETSERNLKKKILPFFNRRQIQIFLNISIHYKKKKKEKMSSMNE